MRSTVRFFLDGRQVELAFSDAEGSRPTTTVLNFLRSLPGHRGVKEGCAEGDCGACTVALAGREADGSVAWRAVDACLMFLPMLDGKHLVTVENLSTPGGALHPVQQALVDFHGSQCGYCTPGFVMSMFALAQSPGQPSREDVDRALTGNLCRCTGYRPIVEAAAAACAQVGGGGDLPAPGEWPPPESLDIATHRQRYFRPVSLPEAVSLRHRYPEALIVAGATDVALRVTKGHELLPCVLDCSNIAELKAITQTEEGFTIGAGVTLEAFAGLAQTHFPDIASVLSVFGSRQIRSMGTLAGNLATASPIGDMIPLLIAHEATVTLESLNGRRALSVESFITGYRATVLRRDELITRILLPRPSGVLRAYKISKRRDLDIATLSAAFRLRLEPGGTVGAFTAVYGGMDIRVRRATGVEQYLRGKAWTREAVEAAARLVDTEFNPLSDVRGSAEFRKAAARNVLIKFWYDTRDSKG